MGKTEQVAAAIHNAHDRAEHGADWAALLYMAETHPDEVHREMTQEFIDARRLEARAAIAAMREPTEAMLKAGDRVRFGVAHDKYPATDSIWQAMIDEALKESD